MSEAGIGGCLTAVTGRESGGATTARTPLLSLAAAPTFAIMALLTGAFGVGAPDALCTATPQGLPLNGMVVMYVLMSVFHSAPWLAMISERRGHGASHR